jgi:hypothetical protein
VVLAKLFREGFERLQPRRRHNANLPQCPTQQLPRPLSLLNEGRFTAKQAAHRGAKALAQTDGDAIDAFRQVTHCNV